PTLFRSAPDVRTSLRHQLAPNREPTPQSSPSQEHGDNPPANTDQHRLDFHRSIEVRVVVQHAEASCFGGCGEQQVGDLAASLMLGREESLNLASPTYVIG